MGVHPTLHRPTDEPDARPLTLAALAGALAWSAQLLLNYFIVEVACKSGALLSPLAGLSLASWLMIAVTVAAALATAYGGYQSRRARERLGPERAAAPRGIKRSSFIAATGVYLNAIFLLLVLITGVPVLILPPCA